MRTDLFSGEVEPADDDPQSAGVKAVPAVHKVVPATSDVKSARSKAAPAVYKVLRAASNADSVRIRVVPAVHKVLVAESDADPINCDRKPGKPGSGGDSLARSAVSWSLALGEG